MISCPCPEDLPERLVSILRADHEVRGPIAGDDGVVRLDRVGSWSALARNALPLIPLKKFLLPPADPLWEQSGPGYCPSGESRSLALVGIAPCDLYALDYLDQVFAGDPLYRARRKRLLVIGTSCRPSEECSCPPRRTPPIFDLFVGKDRIWSGSETGEALLSRLGLAAADEFPSPPLELTDSAGPVPPTDLAERFHAGASWPGWETAARRCLSCGACSAVCPTCYCYDVVDTARADGSVTRFRTWDNCFFRRHALVAGGHNFRPDRVQRLRFRFEHKFLGFGELRGISSCVGCGRCARACPVDIDLADLLVSFTTAETSQ